MTLIKYYDPEFGYSPLSKIFDQFNAVRPSSKDMGPFNPDVDIVETDKNFVINISVPGIKKEDIKIELNNDRLQISGERKKFDTDVSLKFHKQQTAFGKFEKTFKLPETANKENISAKQEDGILSVSIEKIAKKQNKSLIEVK
jgi:HSP20 family protein